MDLTLAGLPVGAYRYLAYHHDTENQNGDFTISVTDADGTRTIGTFEMTASSEGANTPNPVNPGPGISPMVLPSTIHFPIVSNGEPIVIDIGCVLGGYCSDMTRTICLGQPSPKYLEVWEIVRQAQEAAEAAICAGMSGVEADALARDPIAEAGYGEYFGHGLGHGVGLAVHEDPYAGRFSESTLQAGMALTVEPGIYLPGEFGVRIEDLVIVRQEGVEVLTSTPRIPVVA